MKNNDLIDKINKEQGFQSHNNFYLEKEGEKTIIKVELDKESLNIHEIAHGGLIFGLGDTIMGVVIVENTKKKIVTQSSNINFLLPAKGKYLTGEAEIIKNGKNTVVARANIYDDKKRLVATMDGNYFYID